MSGDDGEPHLSSLRSVHRKTDCELEFAQSIGVEAGTAFDARAVDAWINSKITGGATS